MQRLKEAFAWTVLGLAAAGTVAFVGYLIVMLVLSIPEMLDPEQWNFAFFLIGLGVASYFFYRLLSWAFDLVVVRHEDS